MVKLVHRIVVTVSFLFIVIIHMKSSVALSTASKSQKIPSNTQKVFIHWFRHQDLRLHDNPALFETIQASREYGILPIFCFDPRFIHGKTTTPLGSQKCSVRRAQFLLQSVADLRNNLIQKGSGLVVALGKPENILATIIKEWEQGCNNDIATEKIRKRDISVQVFCQEEVASEELSVDRALDKILRRTGIPSSDIHVQGSLVKVWGSTLYHPKDLPFKGGPHGIPDVFTPFRTQVEKVLFVIHLLVCICLKDGPLIVEFGFVITFRSFLPYLYLHF